MDEYHSAATHRPLLITGAWWLLAVNTQEEDRRRGRRTRGSTYYYGSGFFFYFFFFSFAEYVDIGFLNYVIAPGSFHGAEGKCRNGCFSLGSFRGNSVLPDSVPLFNYISPFFPVL